MTSAEEIRSQAVSPVSTLGGAGADSAAKAKFAINRPSGGSAKKILFIYYPLLKIAGFGFPLERKAERFRNTDSELTDRSSKNLLKNSIPLRV